MSGILVNLFRLMIVSSYLLIVLFSFYLIYRKNKYKKAIKENYKPIIINTLIVLIIAVIGFTVFFSIEDFIYDYDYVGHWYRALNITNRFFTDPYSIPAFLHHSLNYDELYSYLIAFFEIPVIIINDSYGFFCFGSFVMFYIPVFILLQILYYAYFYKHRYLPVLIAIVFFEMYLCFFDGETECFGSFFIIISLMLTLFIDFNEIDMIDNLAINLFGWMLIFGRRFYLYGLISIYLCYFFQYLKYYQFKLWNKKAMMGFLKILSSGIVLLLVCVTIYYPFFIRVITNNYSEAYAYNNKSGKLISLVETFTPMIMMICVYGFIKSFKQKENRVIDLELIFTVVFSCTLFWRVQSFELHHYYLISFPFICFFTKGFYEIFENKIKILKYGISGLLVFQTATVFVPITESPLLSGWHRYPKVYRYKSDVLEFADYLTELSSDGSNIYMATGDGNINYSTLIYAKLPNLSSPNFYAKVFDLRDGFPVNLDYCKYLIVSDPICYASKDNQHIYDVITNGVENVSSVKECYELIYTTEIGEVTYKVYKKVAAFSDEAKQYFYDQMISCYPDQKEFFADILK